MLQLKVSVLLHTEVVAKGQISAIIFEFGFLFSSVVRLMCKSKRLLCEFRSIHRVREGLCSYIGSAGVDHLASEICIRMNNVCTGITKK
jgi:hypothetical protein